MRKRSSWASGSGKVPSYSMGFCVAMTMNGDGSSRVTPSTVIVCSSIASSSADCVLGVARLISSARTICAMSGPGRNSKSLGALAVDRDAGDVGRQDVGRELDALERAAGGLGKAAGERGLADARHVLDQQVACAQEADYRQPYFGCLADDYLFDVFQYPFGDEFGVFHLPGSEAMRRSLTHPKRAPMQCGGDCANYSKAYGRYFTPRLLPTG